MLPKKLQNKLESRITENALRIFSTQNNLIDFSSNDYLGFSKNELIFNASYHYLMTNNLKQNGATGSRLLTGNYALYNEVENSICKFYNSEASLIFNSGYNANLGFFSCVPQRGDIILFDEFIHASIRDGIKMSNAKAYKFKHNNLDDLQKKTQKHTQQNNHIYIVTESIFSMDGDSPDLKALSKISTKYNAKLVIDQAHAIGTYGKKDSEFIENINTFARIITFGKALGCHGAAILCSNQLKQYLINFARSLIYTTALPPHSLATIKCAYKELEQTLEIKKLLDNIMFFKSEIKRLQLDKKFIKSDSAIHCCIISGNKNVKNVANYLQENNFSVKPILSPTVKKGAERLRFCLHSYNSRLEITKVLELLVNFV